MFSSLRFSVVLECQDGTRIRAAEIGSGKQALPGQPQSIAGWTCWPRLNLAWTMSHVELGHLTFHFCCMIFHLLYNANHYSTIGPEYWEVMECAMLAINVRKAGITIVARLRLNALCESIPLQSSASILIHRDLDCMLTGSTSLLLPVPFHLRATLMHL